jgi:hypothetical protein
MGKSKENDAFETIILYKANKMKNGLVSGSPYNKHIKKVLRKSGITVCEGQVENFVIGGVDAMIYDIASAVGFTRNTQNLDDWASWEKRQEILKKIFPKRKSKKRTS